MPPVRQNDVHVWPLSQCALPSRRANTRSKQSTVSWTVFWYASLSRRESAWFTGDQLMPADYALLSSIESKESFFFIFFLVFFPQYFFSLYIFFSSVLLSVTRVTSLGWQTVSAQYARGPDQIASLHFISHVLNQLSSRVAQHTFLSWPIR